MPEEHNINMRFTNLQQVQEYAEQSQKLLLVFDNSILDVTTFADHHPGGGVLLRSNKLKNIGEQMKFHQPLTITMANTMAIGSFKKDISRLIQPDQPLMSQIWNVDHKTYLKIVNSPHWLFVQSPRFFDTDFMESFSHNKWYHVPLVPLIVIAFNLYLVPSWQGFHLATFLLAALGGLLMFSLVQYLLHRFVFHSQQYLLDSRICRYLHYCLHGVHHMLPNDPDRLVLPPAAVLLIMTLGYFTVLKVVVFHDWIVFATVWSFFLAGYVIYDIMHYALHHIDTSKHKGSWFHSLQKYHNKHHFSGQYAGFGVSSPLWDLIFRTGYKETRQ